MFIQKDNRAIRKGNILIEDIDFLKKYFLENGNFPLFNQVLIESRTDCNMKCGFCPQAYTPKELGVMKIEVYEEIIRQLVDINFSGRLALYLSNEPLLEDRLIDMIEYARLKSPRFFIDITTNGIKLSSQLVDALYKAGLDNIIVNDYRADREDFPNKISRKLKPIVEDFRYNPKFFYNPRSSREILSNYAGSTGDNNKLYSGFCNFPFRKLTVSYEGDILLCCNDFLYEKKFGNIMSEKVTNIWNSEAMNKYRSGLINDNRAGLCAKCNQTQKYTIY